MTRNIWRILAAALITLFAISSPALAQDEETDDAAIARDRKIQILRVKQDEEAGTIELIVALPAAIGEVAPTTANFGVIEGRNNKTFTVEPVEDNVDVVIVVDTSGSMRGAPLTAARQAAAGFIDRLPPAARVSVVGFGATPTVLTTFENDRSNSRSAVNSLVASGETALWDALLTASETATAGGSRAPYIVVLSDGGDTASAGSQTQANAALEKAGATLYAITLETAESDHRALLSTANMVGGTVLATGDVGGIEGLFDEVGDRLNHRYRIVIESTRTDERALRVSVAIEGAIATASTSIGTGGSSTNPVTDIPNSLGSAESALVVDELGTLTVQGPGGLTGTPSLLVGAAALFTTLLIGAMLITDPLGTRVQSIGSMRAPEATQRVMGVGQRMSGAADRAIAKRDDEAGLDARLDAAGVNMRPGEFAILSILLVVGTGLATLILGGFWWAIAVSLFAAAAVWLFLAIKVSRRRKAFASQLHSTITVLVGSMRAGRGLPQAIELVATEMSAPTSEEFRRIVVESRVGRDPVVSMEMVAKRMDNEDLRWIAQAVAINRELGGDLTELLDKLAGVIRDRGRLKLQVRALSAEGRISAWVVGALPILIFGYMHIANAEYVSLLYRSSAGAMMLIAGIILMIGGAIWMKKLVDVQF